MRPYRMSGAAADAHTPRNPDRTARRNVGGRDASGCPNFDVEFREWPSRAAMLATIRMQEQREHRETDWRACVR